jgi:hypothetical protein
MPALFKLDVETDPPARRAVLRLYDQGGTFVAAHEVELAKHPPATWEGLFDTRNHVRRLRGVTPESRRLVELGQFLGEHVLGPDIAKALAAGIDSRTLLVRLPGDPGDLLAAAFARVPWEIARALGDDRTLASRNVVVRAALAGTEPAPRGVARPGREGGGARAPRVRRGAGAALMARQATRHEPIHRDVDECLGCSGKPLVVLAQATFTIEPPESALHDPSSGKDLERMHVGRLLDDLNINIQFITGTLKDGGISSVCPHICDRWIHSVGAFQELPPTISVLDAGRKHHDGQDQAQHIYENIPLPAHDVFPCVISARTAHLRRLHRLAVHNPSRRLRLTPFPLPNPGTESIVDPLPRSIQFPLAEIAVDQLPLGKVMGKHSPLTAGSGHVEDGVDDLASRVLNRLRARFGCWNQGLQDLPLRVGQVGFPAFGLHAPQRWANSQLNKLLRLP